MPQSGGRKSKKGKYQTRRLYLHERAFGVLDKVKEMNHPELTQSKFVEALVEPFNPPMELRLDQYEIRRSSVYMWIRNMREEEVPITAVLCNDEMVAFKINLLNPVPPKSQYGGGTVIQFRLPKEPKKGDFIVTLKSTYASNSFTLRRKGSPAA
jgi:hypothetical protein